MLLNIICKCVKRWPQIYCLQMNHCSQSVSQLWAPSILLHHNQNQNRMIHPVQDVQYFSRMQPFMEDIQGIKIFLIKFTFYFCYLRFRNLVRNIRGRRGEKVAINIPIFRDKNTPSPFIVFQFKLKYNF